MSASSTRRHTTVRLTAADEKALEHIPLLMVRDDLTELPSFPLPPGYRLRRFRRGDERLWVEINLSIGAFDGSLERGLEYFEKEFGAARDQMESRCLFLETADGKAVGTTTAWFNPSFRGREYGRIHWVAIRPEHQGKKLAKPLLAAALARLAELHDRAYLSTQTTSARAIHMYLDFGFEPYITSEREEAGWRLLASVLQHPALSAFRTASR